MTIQGIRLRRVLTLSSGVSTLALFMASPAFAQTAPAADDEADTIIVTGFAASLQSAAKEKRTAVQIVESVNAEDIGKLPDASIAESIARLPGLTSQRLLGRSSVISIRGLGPDLSTTLLNGREQTSTGDNRAVEFDQYASEVVSQVLVYKSPTANLIGQGLAGTIDIRTIRPLDKSERIIAIGGRGVYNDLGRLNAGSKDKGYRVNATFVDQFANDTLGIALGASYVDEPYQTQEFNAWGYNGVTVGTATNQALIGGSKSYVNSTQLKRLGITGTLQWRPQPELTFSLDGFYSSFKDNSIKRGIEFPLGFFAFGTTGPGANAVASNGQVVSGTFSNVRGVVRNDVNERNADLYSLGFNAEWKGDDGWGASFDVGYSKTDRNELIIESYAGTGFNGDDTGVGAAGTLGFVSGPTGTRFTPSLNYSDPTLIRLTDPLGWGGGTVPQAGYYNNRIVKDDLKQFRVAVEKTFDTGFIAAIKGGLGYIDRNKSLTPDEAFVRLPGTATIATIPSSRLLRPTNLNFLGLGPMVSYDPRQLIADGTLVLERRPNVQDILSKQYTVSEALMQAYVQADLRQEIGSATLTGNVGGQVIITKQSSSGNTFLAGVARPITLGANYTDFLPSLNLTLAFPGDFQIRFAASKQLQRPRIDDMRVAIGYGYNAGCFIPGINTVGTSGCISGGGGNPFLQPFRANAVDLNFEKYFKGGGYVSAQLFYKDLKNFIFNGQFLFDYAGLPTPPGTPAGTSTIGILDAPVNTGGGSIKGAELSTNIPFGSIIPALDGFGVTGGAGYTETKVTNISGQIQSIPGYSEWTASGTIYFEKAGFSARASARYRSSFLGELSTFGGARGNRQAVSETIIDAQIGYDFKEVGPLKGLSIFVQGQNLTNEPFKTVANLAQPLTVIDYQTYGRRIYVGAALKF
jgi:iron complex outermembrane recepter protein